ncbi:MAG: haloacid dehalogenase type II [Pseudomonadota bacterium]
MAKIGYVFDAYGTLFDVHSAMRKLADEVGPDYAAISDTWRNKQLEYSWVRSLMGSYQEFWKLTGDALDFALKHHDRDDAALRDKLMEQYWTLDAYDDVLPTLKRLREDGNRIAILSNGSPDMLKAATESSGISELVDEVFSVDAVKVFKTSPDVYRMVTDAWDCPAKSVGFVSSNRWDIAATSKFEFKTVWLNRSGATDEYLNYPPQRMIATLAEL